MALPTRRQSWKDFAGRSHGNDSYHFGDLSRKLFPQLFHGSRGSQQQPSRKPPASSCPLPTATAEEDARRPSAEGETDGMMPLDRAALGLRRLHEGLDTFAQLDLPHGATALEKIRLGIEELKARIDEEAAYQQRLPENGKLLQVQVCSAADDENPSEWSMGQLYASTDILFFESNDTPMPTGTFSSSVLAEPTTQWCVGPLRWDTIASMQRLQESGPGSACAGDIRVVVAGTGRVFFITGLCNLDVLEKMGGLTQAPLRTGGGYVQAPNVKDSLDEWARYADGYWMTPAEASGDMDEAGRSPTKSDTAAGAERSGELPTPELWMRSVCATCDETGDDELGSAADIEPESPSELPTATFLRSAESLPHEAPRQTEPTFQIPMPRATIAGIRKLLLINENWPIRLYLEEHLKVSEVQESRWAASNRIAGTSMRRLRFRMPVPADVPQAVKRLISLPESSQVTLLARVGCSSESIILVHELCTHDVTYGENFWVRDVLVFRSDPAGGIIFEKFTNVRWVQALPWYASVLGTYIEMRAKQDSKEAGTFLAKYLERTHGM